MQHSKNLDVSVLGNGCIHRLAPGGYSAGEVGDVRKSLVRKKMRHPHGSAAGVAHHDRLRIRARTPPSRAGIWFMGTCTTSGMLASCSSQSSRTSMTSGFSPRSRRALSSCDRNLANHGASRTETRSGRGALSSASTAVSNKPGAVPGRLRRCASPAWPPAAELVADHDEKLPTHG